MSTERQAEYESKGELRESQMKPRTAQPGARKNPDSPRVHGLRLTVNPSLESVREFGSPHDEGEAPSSPSHATRTFESRLTDVARGTVEQRAKTERLLSVEEVAGLLHVPVSWVYARTRKRSSERLPGYRLGKYWRFNEAEVLAWLAAQSGNDYHHA